MNCANTCMFFISSLFTFSTGSSMNITSTGNNGIKLRYGSEWKGSTSGGFTISSIDEACKLESGSTMANSVNFVNSGTGDDFKCGGNPAGALVTQNDLGAGSPQNCFAFVN